MADVFDFLEGVGRFGIFWSFVLSGRFRRDVLAGWKKAGAIRRFFMLFEGLMNAFIGLMPVWLPALVYWWRS